MAYDPAGRSTLLFGGFPATPGLILGDTWMWNGDAWTPYTSAVAPASRAFHSMATDPLRQRILLYGGRNGLLGSLTDTWEWDGSQWHLVQPATRNPGVREYAAMSWNPVTQRIASFGSMGLPLLPVEEWDGSDWYRLSAAGPLQPAAPQYGFAIPDPAGMGVRLYGADYSTHVRQEYLWNGASLTSVPVPANLPGYGVLMSDEARGRILFISAFWTVWGQDVATNAWGVVANPDGVPSISEIAHAPWLDASVALGGSANNSGLWLRTDAGYRFLGAVPGTTSPRLLVHLGTREVYCQEYQQPRLWRYDWPGWSLSQVSVGTGTTLGMVGLDPRDGGMFCFDQATQWFCKWTGTVITPVTPKPPVLHIYYDERFAFDPNRFVVAFYRGGTLWEWDGVSWTSQTTPAVNGMTALVYVPGLGIVLMGASSMYAWDGVAWTMHVPTRSASGGVFLPHYDANRNKVRAVLSGFEQVWEMEFRQLVVTPEEPRPGATLAIQVESSAHAGQPWVLGMAWDTYPGIPLTGLHPQPHRVLPLSADSLFHASLAVGLQGFLDGGGRAQRTWTLPATPSLSGLQFYMCAVSITPQLTAGLVSNAVEIYILP